MKAREEFVKQITNPISESPLTELAGCITLTF